MFEYFSTEGFMPHGHCYLWTPGILWLHVVSDLLIVASYYSIPLALIFFIRKRKDLAFNWVFRLFAAFIFWCGTTHLMAVWVTWNPSYWLDGSVKAITAGVSVVTAIMLWPLIPKALKYPSPGELQRMNEVLQEQIRERMRAEVDLSELNQSLERRVDERTRELERQEDKFRRVVENAASAILMIDEERKITFTNRQAEDLFGYSREELIGRPIETLVPERYREGHPGFVAQFLKAPQPRAMGAGRDLYALRRDGTEVPVEIGLNPVTESDGSVSVLASVIDITERKRAEDSLRRTNADLEQFSYAVSHDLREPLRAMAGYAYLLQNHVGENGLDKEGMDFLAQIIAGGGRMDKLITGLLAYARVGGGAIAVEDIPLSEVVSEVLRDLSDLKQRSGAEIEVGDLPHVRTRAPLVRQVIQNLVANAMRYGAREGEAPRVRVSAHPDAGGWRIEVADEGPGIAPSSHERVFKIFQQLHRTENSEGTGMGLAIALKIVKSLGGRLWVESDGKSGSRFCFTLAELPTGAGAQEARV